MLGRSACGQFSPQFFAHLAGSIYQTRAKAGFDT